jgi:hypothetical protein
MAGKSEPRVDAESTDFVRNFLLLDWTSLDLSLGYAMNITVSVKP